jgi:hypothetical protein
VLAPPAKAAGPGGRPRHSVPTPGHRVHRSWPTAQWPWQSPAFAEDGLGTVWLSRAIELSSDEAPYGGSISADWARSISEPLRPGDIPGAFVKHVALLLQPMPQGEDRYEAFRDWVEEEIHEPLLPANADLVDRLAQIVRADTERLNRRGGRFRSVISCSFHQTLRNEYRH